MFRSLCSLLIINFIFLNACSNSNVKIDKIKVSNDRYSVPEAATIRVASILPLSGKNRKIGEAILNSCMLAIENYKSVEMLVLDSDLITSNPNGLNNLLFRNNVKYVIGPVFSNEAIKVQNASSRIKYFSLSNNSKIANSNLVICGISPKDDIEMLFRYQLSAGSKKILALIPKNSYGDTINDIINNLDTKDSYIRKIRYSKYSNDIIYEQLDDMNFDTIFVCDNLDKPSIRDVTYMIPYNLLTYDFLENHNVVYASPDEKKLLKFRKYYRDHFNMEPSNIALVGFDIANLVFSICDKDIDDLQGKQYRGVLGNFRINNNVIERQWEIYEKN